MRNLLIELGASQKEASAFLTLLELGAQPVSVLAKRLSMPRSSTYLLMERLNELGLVEEFERNKIKYIKCIPVESIKDLISLQERKLKQLQNLYQEKLPDLVALENRLSITPQIKHYEGQTAVMRMYEETLHGQKFDAIFNPKLVKKHMPQYYQAVPQMAAESGVEIREILVPSKDATDYKMKFEGPTHQIAILPQGTELNTDIIITANEIYMVAYGEREVSATEIRNPVLAQAHRVLFDGWWGRLAA